MDLLVRKAFKVQLDRKAHKDPPVRKVSKALLVTLDHKAQLDLKASKVQLAQQATQDRRVYRVSQDRQDHKARRQD